MGELPIFSLIEKEQTNKKNKTKQKTKTKNKKKKNNNKKKKEKISSKPKNKNQRLKCDFQTYAHCQLGQAIYLFLLALNHITHTDVNKNNSLFLRNQP